MAKIVLVHGINHHLETADGVESVWIPALARRLLGVRRHEIKLIVSEHAVADVGENHRLLGLGGAVDRRADGVFCFLHRRVEKQAGGANSEPNADAIAGALGHQFVESRRHVRQEA